MAETSCHASPSPKAAARDVILKTLGVKRIADWCGCSEAAVYQWISRGTDAEPIPPAKVAMITVGASAAGIAFDVRALWPAMPAAFLPPAVEVAEAR